MLSRQKRTDIRKLSSKKHRISSGQFIAEGRRAVDQLIRNGAVPVEVVITDGRPAPESATVVEVLDRASFAALRTTESSQGVLAVCTRPEPLADQAVLSVPGLIVVVDALQDPGNLGTLYRTAVWFGAGALYLGSGTTDLFQPKVVRSTAGATGVLPYGQGSVRPFLLAAMAAGRNVWLLDGGPGAVPLSDASPDPNALIVVGNEGSGLSADLRRGGFRRLSVPGRTSHVESLNAAVAASIVMHHLTRPTT